MILEFTKLIGLWESSSKWSMLNGRLRSYLINYSQKCNGRVARVVKIYLDFIHPNQIKPASN